MYINSKFKKPRTLDAPKGTVIYCSFDNDLETVIITCNNRRIFCLILYEDRRYLGSESEITQKRFTVFVIRQNYFFGKFSVILRITKRFYRISCKNKSLPRCCHFDERLIHADWERNHVRYLVSTKA